MRSLLLRETGNLGFRHANSAAVHLEPSKRFLSSSRMTRSEILESPPLLQFVPSTQTYLLGDYEFFRSTMSSELNQCCQLACGAEVSEWRDGKCWLFYLKEENTSASSLLESYQRFDLLLLLFLRASNSFCKPDNKLGLETKKQTFHPQWFLQEALKAK